MKAPKFWYQTTPLSGIADAALAPLAKAYTKLGRHHRTHAGNSSKAVSIPVVCIGNIVAGGSGKTPTAIAIKSLLQDERISLSPFFLTRGYRGKIEGPERVDDSHDPELWGDEALLLARHAPVIVSKNRCKGAELAQSMSADVIIMDDGMQNYTLRKNITFCVVDGKTGFGNGQVMPAGPLRQPLEDGFDLTDAFILIGEDKKSLQKVLPSDKPVFTAYLQPKPDHGLALDANYIAFCGIGFPEKFRDSLQQAGVNVLSFHAFSDHHYYSLDDLKKLFNESRGKNAHLITTEKDFARLPNFLQKDLIKVLPVEVRFEDRAALSNYIKTSLNPASPSA